ncbi:MAG: TonB-dependent receptor plug domain-containing protein, partial [Sphingomicrobium sp.]
MTSRLTLLLASTILAAGPALARQDAQAAPPPQPAAQPAPAPADTATEEDDGTIVVTGERPRGSVVGDIPPENVLTSRDIRATGATSIAELLDSIAAQTGSARGRSSGRPILLLNGLRISGFRELRDLPPEAIERMEILPEEVALKYGYSADSRVVNIVLRRRFDSTSTEVGGTLATDGGYAAGRADATKLIIADGRRTSLNAHVEGNNPLYESERDILLDPASTAADARAYRTLVGAQQSARVTGTLNRTIGKDIGATITAEVGRTHSRSRFGIDPFTVNDPLTRSTTSDSFGIGAVLNAQRGKWRLSSTANADLDRNVTDSDRSLPLAPNDDVSHSTTRSLAADVTATGPLLALPAGDATATFKLGLSRLELDGRARRVGVETRTSLGRTIGNGSVSLDLPIVRRASAIGRLTGNLNAGVSRLSDFGTLTSLGAGLDWTPADRLSLIGSATREEGAPSLSQLGDPLVATANVPFFDAVRGESVSVTAISGGNPALAADRRTVWKLGGNWQPSEKLDLSFRADFVHQSIDRPQIGFPAVTPALEAAFPGRFVRDGGGQLVQVDLRPVNADSSRRDTLRLGFDFTKSLKSTPPSRDQINALRKRLGQPALTGAPGANGPGGGPGGSARFDGPPGGGRGFGGGG